MVEATDTVQVLNERLSHAGKGGPLKGVNNAQATLVAAENDMRAAETALEAARNRLRILGRSDDDLVSFGQNGLCVLKTSFGDDVGFRQGFNRMLVLK